MNTTADELREQARQADRAAQESFERSDTDGFLSQWASGLTAQKLRAQADLEEWGGVIEHLALFLNGELASTHQCHGQFGLYWVLNDAAAALYGKRFFTGSMARNATARDRARGFTYGTVRVRGYVDIASSGTGLSGAASARVVIRPVVADLMMGEFEVTATDGAYAHLGQD